jgi:S1-C subfamily serine protease
VVPDAVSGQSPIVSGSPADKAGLQAGDVIKKVNGDTVTTGQGLTSLLNHYQPGDSVKLTVVRGSKTIQLNATLASAKG